MTIKENNNIKIIEKKPILKETKNIQKETKEWLNNFLEEIKLSKLLEEEDYQKGIEYIFNKHLNNKEEVA